MKQQFKVLFWSATISSVASGILLVGMSFFRWTLIDILTPFFEPILEFVVWGLVIIVLLWSLIYMLVAFRKEKLLAVIPFFISFFVLVFVIFFPLTRVAIYYDFNSNLKERTTIIEQIESGKLKQEVSGNTGLISLPADNVHLSKGGGEVLYEKNGSTSSVLFFTFRGIMDNFSGFIYRSDDSKPKPTDFGGDFFQIIKLGDHWFWAASK